jgi:DNA-binding response OmpR family regulator
MKSILVIDDEILIVEMLSAFLQEEGWRVMMSRPVQLRAD